jgi:hypothetical protein
MIPKFFSMKIIISSLGYIILTFPLAFFWHLRAFRSQYERWQYFGSNAQPILGLAAMIIQGLVLSIAYPYFGFSTQGIYNSSIYVLIIFVLFWSIHVISTMAKTKETRTLGFFVMETIYLMIQFGMYGVLLGVIY